MCEVIWWKCFIFPVVKLSNLKSVTINVLQSNFSGHPSPRWLSPAEAPPRTGSPAQDPPPAKQVSEAACSQRRARDGETGTCLMSFKNVQKIYDWTSVQHIGGYLWFITSQSQVHILGDHGGLRHVSTSSRSTCLRIYFVDFDLVVPLSAIICFGRWKSGRDGKANGKLGGTPKSKSNKSSGWPWWSKTTFCWLNFWSSSILPTFSAISAQFSPGKAKLGRQWNNRSEVSKT